MKLAYWFAVSATLHAALFAVPSLSPENPEERIVPVRIVVSDGTELNGDRKKPQLPKRVGNAPHLRARGKLDQTSLEPGTAGNRIHSTPPEPVPAAETVSAIPPAVMTEEAGSLSSASRAGFGGSSSANGAGGTWLSGAQTGGAGAGTGKTAAPLAYAHAGYLNNPAPKYPERARRQGWEGTVLLNVLVSSEGKPQKIQIKQSTGFEILDQAAITAVTGWRFHPARYGETPLESWVRVPIVFRLNDEKK